MHVGQGEQHLRPRVSVHSGLQSNGTERNSGAGVSSTFPEYNQHSPHDSLSATFEYGQISAIRLRLVWQWSLLRSSGTATDSARECPKSKPVSHLRREGQDDAVSRLGLGFGQDDSRYVRLCSLCWFLSCINLKLNECAFPPTYLVCLSCLQLSMKNIRWKMKSGNTLVTILRRFDLKGTHG